MPSALTYSDEEDKDRKEKAKLKKKPIKMAGEEDRQWHHEEDEDET